MMFWYGNDMSGWGYALMAVAMVVFWALVVFGAIVLIRYSLRSDQPPAASWPTPEQVLADRFARGELDETEYRQRRSVLSDRFGPMVESSDS